MATTEQEMALATSKESTSSLYYFLESLLESTPRSPIFDQYTVSKMKLIDAYLIEPKSKDSLLDIVLDDQVFTFDNYHLRIDKMAYTKENSPKSLIGLDPSHISIYYRSSTTNQSLVIHLYYSASGNFLSISSKIDETKIILEKQHVNRIKNETYNIYEILRKILKEKSTLLSNLISESDNLQSTLETLSVRIHQPKKRQEYYEKSKDFINLISRINQLNDLEYDCRDKRIQELVGIWKSKYDNSTTTSLPEKDGQSATKNETATTNVNFSNLIEHSTKKSNSNNTSAVNNAETELFETLSSKFNNLYSKFSQSEINEAVKLLDNILSTNVGLYKEAPKKDTPYKNKTIENIVSINKILKDLEICLIEISPSKEEKFSEKIIELKLKIKTLKHFFHSILFASGATGDFDTFKILFDISHQKFNIKLCLTILGMSIFAENQKMSDGILTVCDYLFEKSTAFRNAISVLRYYYELESGSTPNLVTFLAEALSLERWNVVKKLLAYDESIADTGIVCNSVFLSPVIISIFKIHRTGSLDCLIELRNHGVLFNNRRKKDVSSMIFSADFLNESKIDKKQISKMERKNYTSVSDKNREQEWSWVLKKFSSDLEVAVFYKADNALGILSEYCDISQLAGAISLFMSFHPSKVHFATKKNPLGFQCSIEPPQEPQELASENSETKNYFSIWLKSDNPHIQLVANKLIAERSKRQNQKQIQQVITDTLNLYQKNSPDIVLINNNLVHTTSFDLMKVIILLAIQKKPLDTVIGEMLMWTLSTMSKNNEGALLYLTSAAEIPDLSDDLSALKTGKFKPLYDHIQKNLKKIKPSTDNDGPDNNFMPMRQMQLASNSGYYDGNNNNNNNRNRNCNQQG